MNVKKSYLSLALMLCTLSFAVKAVDPGFSILNKTGKNIYIGIQEDRQPARGMEIVKAKGEFHQNIKSSYSTALFIYLRKPTSPSHTEYSRVNYPMPKPDFWYNLGQSKKIYVSFDTAKSPEVYPQSGNLFGKTTKGYSLKGNLTQYDIKPIRVNELYSSLEKALKARNKQTADTLQKELDKYREGEVIPPVPGYTP